MEKQSSKVANKPEHSRRNWAFALAAAIVVAGGALAATAPLTQGEPWEAMAPGQMRVFVDGRTVAGAN